MGSSVVVSLLPDPAWSDRLLQRLAREQPDLTLLRPPDGLLPGLWDDDGGVDEWWATAVRPLSDQPLVIVDDAPSRSQDLLCCPQVGLWLVWCATRAASIAYAGLDGVLALVAADVDGLARAVQLHIAPGRTGESPAATTPAARARAVAAPAPRAVPAPPPVVVRAVAPRTLATSQAPSGRQAPIPSVAVVPCDRSMAPRPAAPHRGAPPPPPPFAALASALPRVMPAPFASTAPNGCAITRSADTPVQAPTPVASVGCERAPEHAPRAHRSITGEVATALRSAVAAVRDRLAPSPSRPDLAALGQQLVRRRSLVVVALNTKGGVGKTTNCSALALLGGKAVEPHGGWAVFIDANPTNPNGRAKLGLPDDTPRLRSLVDALATGAVAPEGATLKGYRVRAFIGTQGAGFARAEVRRVAKDLRTRFHLIVVDLANAYPSLSGGPSGESAHHWLQEADVVLVPTDPDENTFEGAGETIDAVKEMAEAAGKPRPPIVVSFLARPRGEALKEAGIRQCLAHLGEAGIPVVSVPNVERVALASWRKRQVIEVSPQANRAWERVLAAVINAQPAEAAIR